MKTETVKSIMATFNDTIDKLKDHSKAQRAEAISTEAELSKLRKKKEANIKEALQATRIAKKLAKVVA